MKLINELSKCCIIFAYLFFPITVTYSSSISPEPQQLVKGTCGDASWKPFADIKCYKVIQLYNSWTDAGTACQSETVEYTVDLATIKSAEEQAFVTSYLFNETGVLNNVWIGASRRSQSGTDFGWVDGEGLEYSNWLDGSPTGEDGKDCVELESGLGKDETVGRWKDVTCAKGNYALCERLQSWNSEETQTIILQMRKELEKLKTGHDSLQDNFDQLQASHDNLRNNPVPIGFLYAQFGDQADPSILWPQLTWMDVTSQYAGQFFRALGGNSSSFGSTQDENAPRLTDVYWTDIDGCSGSSGPLPVGGQSNCVYGGKYPWSDCVCGHDATDTTGFYFTTSGGEIRPYNSALKLFKRTA